MPTDEQLLADCQRGNVDAFALFYDAHVDRVYAFIARRVEHRQAAEDLTSTVFLKALESVTSYRGGSAVAWVFRIARNTVIDHYRTRRVHADLEAVPQLAGDDNPARTAEQRLELERVQRALDTLTPDQRDLLTLRLWEDLSYADIAALLGKTEAGCKMAASRALAALRRLLTSPRT